MKQKANKILLDILYAEGVEIIFGNPGTTELAIMEAVGKQDRINYVLGLQEAVVVAMADGYARASGQLAAANVHVAPGLGNAMGSLYNAKFHGSPLILTAGQQEQGHGLMEPMLYEPLVPMAQPLVKWATEITRSRDLERVMRRAAKVALSPPTGPVFVSLPGDILDEYVDDLKSQQTRVITDTRPSDTVISAVVGRILESKKPLIIAGNELATRNALSQAGEFATIIGAPVWQQTVPHGAHFLTEHNCFQGHLTRSQGEVRKILKGHDLLIFLGADVLRMSVMSKTEPIPPDASILHISERAWDLGKNYAAEIAINANVCKTLEALISEIRVRSNLKYQQSVHKRVTNYSRTNWRSKRKNLIAQTQTITPCLPMNCQRLMMVIANNISDDAVIVEEGLSSTTTLLNFLSISQRNRFFGLASGGIGFATAGAIGVSLAIPSRPIIAIIGDGSIMYSIQALWTAAHLDLPITYLILNNKGYKILKERLKSFRSAENYVGMVLEKPLIDFVSLAKSLGVPARKATSEHEICDVLKFADDRAGPLLLDIDV